MQPYVVHPYRTVFYADYDESVSFTKFLIIDQLHPSQRFEIFFSFDFFYFFSKHNQWTKSQILAETKKRQKEHELRLQAEEKIKNGLKVDLKIKIRIEILNTSSFYGPFHNLFQNLFSIYRFSATRWSQIHFYMD